MNNSQNGNPASLTSPVLTSVWDGLSSHLIASFYEVAKVGEHAWDRIEGDGGTDSYLQEDITIRAFEDSVVLEQLHPMTEEPQFITLSMAQLRDLAAALDLPEGSYRIERSKG